MSVPDRDKRLFVREVGAALSLWEHNQSVISAAHVLLLSPGRLEEWRFCIAAYVEAIKFLTGARMCLYLEICAWDIKCFVWHWSAFTLPKVRPVGPGCFFPPSICTNVGCMWPVEQGNETGLADWPEDQSLDSP